MQILFSGFFKSKTLLLMLGHISEKRISIVIKHNTPSLFL
jgi:hypothetical protein